MSIENKDSNDQPSTVHINNNNSHPTARLSNNDDGHNDQSTASFYSVASSDDSDFTNQPFVSFDKSNISFNESPDRTLIHSESTPKKFDNYTASNQSDKLDTGLSPIDKERAPDITEGDLGGSELAESGSTTWNTCFKGTTHLWNSESGQNLTTDPFWTPVELTSNVSVRFCILSAHKASTTANWTSMTRRD